jgi:hypothetical protein
MPGKDPVRMRVIVRSGYPASIKSSTWKVWSVAV